MANLDCSIVESEKGTEDEGANLKILLYLYD